MRGISALVDPDDEPYLAILEICAAERRRLGMESYTRAELERLFAVLDAPAPPPVLPANVIPFDRRR